MAGRGGKGQKGFSARLRVGRLDLSSKSFLAVENGSSSWQKKTPDPKPFLAAEGGQGGRVHGKRDFVSGGHLPLASSPPLAKPGEEAQSLPGGQRGGSAAKLTLGSDESFLAAEGGQRGGSRQRGLCVRGASPPWPTPPSWPSQAKRIRVLLVGRGGVDGKKRLWTQI